MLLKLKIWLLLWFYKTINGYYTVSTKLLFAQAYHETGNFKSEVYKENKNLFGMREAKVRKKTAIGTNKGHAVYKNHRQSIIDYFLRQKNFNIPNSSDNTYMLNTVASNYAEDPLYLQKWRALKTKVKVPFVVNILVYGGLFFLLLIMFLILRKTSKQ
ncbi:glucosaminidase domain-containing protein [Thalassobellus citreus]|uniref:glucosaminidase domain-containing protein n=1 Tax=Thalassobellus citreus TaxID=3367752 RepID=UPI0037BD6254